jgi:phosphoserine aminotransferase
MTGGGTMMNTPPLHIWHEQDAEFFSCYLKGEGGVCLNYTRNSEFSSFITACLLRSQAEPQILVVSASGVFRKHKKTLSDMYFFC